jgi:hypothetical protein
LLPKERSFGKQKKKKEINEIDLNYELGYITIITIQNWCNPTTTVKHAIYVSGIKRVV